MPVWIIILLLVCLIALMIIILSVLIREFSSSLFTKFKTIKPKIIVYKSEKPNKKDGLPK